MCNAEDRNKASGCLVSVLPLVLETNPRGRRPSAGPEYVPPCRFGAIDNQTWSNFFLSPQPPPPCMVDNRFIKVLNGRDPITLFQPAHSVMQAGVGPIGKLSRGLLEARGVGGPFQGDPALQILHSLYPIRKAFMQGRGMWATGSSLQMSSAGKVTRLLDMQQ